MTWKTVCFFYFLSFFSLAGLSRLLLKAQFSQRLSFFLMLNMCIQKYILSGIHGYRWNLFTFLWQCSQCLALEIGLNSEGFTNCLCKSHQNWSFFVLILNFYPIQELTYSIYYLYSSHSRQAPFSHILSLSILPCKAVKQLTATPPCSYNGSILSWVLIVIR